MIARYDKINQVVASLDPLESILCWVKGLRSKGYVIDMLIEHHGFKTLESAKKRALLISEHAELATKYLDQGFNGPIEISFLPIYYGLLDLAKIYVLATESFPLSRFVENRWHGASYKIGRSRKFQNDYVTLKPKGAISLFYEVITGTNITTKHNIKVSDIYPLIKDISYEYGELHGKDLRFQDCQLAFKGDSSDGFYLELILKGDIKKAAGKRAVNKFLQDFHKIAKNKYETKRLKGVDASIAESSLKKSIKRYLISEMEFSNHEIATSLPLSGKGVLFPEELPILLAFFHLSSIVRYDPSYIFLLKDSAEWGMLQALSKQGSYKFLKLFWSYMIQASTHVSMI